jgi:hypothetical protein
MDEIERYVFDTQGCLIIPEVLSPAEVRRLLSGIPRDADGKIVTAENPSTFRGLLNHAEPLFRELIAHPRILPCLRALLGGKEGEPGAGDIFLDDEYGLCFERGQLGPWFHNGGTPWSPWLGYQVREGRMYCGYVAVDWALTDVAAGDGGFWYIPGSHKASFPLPKAIETYERVPGCVVQPALKAGSAVIFTEALTHGTRNWTAAHQRIALIYKYLPGHMPWPRRGPVTAPLSETQRRFFAPTAAR